MNLITELNIAQYENETCDGLVWYFDIRLDATNLDIEKFEKETNMYCVDERECYNPEFDDITEKTHVIFISNDVYVKFQDCLNRALTVLNLQNIEISLINSHAY